MKQLKLLSAYIILASLFACEPVVTFNEPQPADTDNLANFPRRLQGEYLSLTDNSMLLINDKLIQRIYDYDFKLHLNELDSNSRLFGDTIIDLITNEKLLIKRDGDSLIRHVHYIDTLFQMDYDNVLRKLKGYYFMSIRHDKESWKVKKIQLLKGELIISNISTKLDIDNLKEITESLTDTIPPYKFAPTKKQFKEFIKKEGFRDSEIFVRQGSFKMEWKKWKTEILKKQG